MALTCFKTSCQLEVRNINVPPFKSVARISHCALSQIESDLVLDSKGEGNLPMSKEIDSSCGTFVPLLIPRFPGGRQIKLVTF